MPRDDDQSLGGEQTFSGKVERDDSPQSLGDQGTYAGGPGVRDTQSLGDQSTFGDAGGDDEPFDDGMEVVDLSARYTIERVLGKGGMGEVQLAMDTRLERKVAIKRMLGDGAKSRTAVSRFISEAKAIAKLDHDNIVDVYDYGRSSDGPFLVMQYVDGGSLLDRCQAGALPVEDAVDLICQVCDALTMCHDAGVIHRDIKPANILMTRDGSPRLTDFGLVKEDTEDRDKTRAGDVLGTLDFMPPEQRRGSAEVDARSDLWSLAATLYQMVSGEPPRVIDLDDVPQQLRPVISKGLKRKPEARFQTAAEFRDALRTCLKSVAEPVPEVVVDLGAGECPQCHIKNDLSRKFCRTPSCAASLRVECLQCKETIPVWDMVCGECGANQEILTSARRAELDVQREQAESLCKEYAFDESLVIAQEIAAVEDCRLQHLKEWSETFIAETETEKVRQQQDAQSHFTESQTHRDAYDYPAAIRVLEMIPEAIRTSAISDYLLQLRSDQQESEELIETISERVQQRDLDGLREQVERALDLRGDRSDLWKMQWQLTEKADPVRFEKPRFILGIDISGAAIRVTTSLHPLTSSDRPEVKVLFEFEHAVAFSHVGHPLFGEAAANRYVTDTSCALYRPAWLISHLCTHPESLDSSLFQTDSSGYLHFRWGKKFLPVWQSLAFLLLQARRKVERMNSETCHKVVLSIPGNFGHLERLAVAKAAQSAGFEVSRMLTATDATALAHHSRRDEKICVVNVGICSLDVGVFEVSDELVEGLSKVSEPRLGIEAADDCICRYVCEVIEQQCGFTINTDEQLLRYVRQLCASLRTTLSTMDVAEITIPIPSMGRNVSIQVCRSDVEQALEPLLQHLSQAFVLALKDARLGPDEIDRVVCTGEPAPGIGAGIDGFFGSEVVRRSECPKEMSARGAALQGQIISGDLVDVVTMQTLDRTIGVKTADGKITPLIDKPCLIPTTKSETFTTEVDNQSEATVEVFEVIRLPDHKSRMIGKIQLKDIPPSPRGVPQIEVTFDIDVSGILNVSAKDKASGKEQTLRLDRLRSKRPRSTKGTRGIVLDESEECDIDLEGSDLHLDLG